jgi:hypothetical protein
MHSDLERLLSEDEAARASVEAARSRARVALETVRADLACQREARLRELQQELDRSVAQILAEGDGEVERRRAQREAHAREDTARTETLIERGADLWVQIVRKGASLREAR